jgi:hypothetical protein
MHSVFLPPDLDDQGSIRLEKFAERVAKWREADARPRTFRIARRKCATCDGVGLARELAGPGAIDCSNLSMDAVTTCARASKTFFATGVPRAPGRTVFYSTGADGVLREVSYEEGYRVCDAQVTVSRCGSWTESNDWLQCYRPVNEPDLRCSERDSLAIEWSAATPTSELYCYTDLGGESYKDCVRGAEPGFEVRPKTNGAPLVCTRDLHGRLNCQREMSME